MRAILNISAEEKMYLSQFDVSTAFLYGELDETIYMQQPGSYKDGTERVCKLKRSLYGLKQGPRCWNNSFGQFVLKLGFKASDADPCLYSKEVNGRKLLIVLYVDNGLVVATNQDLDNSS
ncbi:Retrovirus-related Pol polyprotein from transposon TNT 1-94 [Araneus ventricosus]|uniref:Retrovirus-related Pol polyprotein from transposon TNT 1-94 n=1 Tax=Araneus ventricosus TaxID=182803 RepID=A0A4Y2I7U1_ARAVE|nr:Retrovirus-related Pol polyprotein from transposon TNT 1-94 [Araneus ventricosus]